MEWRREGGAAACPYSDPVDRPEIRGADATDPPGGQGGCHALPLNGCVDHLAPPPLPRRSASRVACGIEVAGGTHSLLGGGGGGLRPRPPHTASQERRAPGPSQMDRRGGAAMCRHKTPRGHRAAPPDGGRQAAGLVPGSAGGSLPGHGGGGGCRKRALGRGGRVGVRQGCVRDSRGLHSKGRNGEIPEAVRQAVGGGCPSGWGQLLSSGGGGGESDGGPTVWLGLCAPLLAIPQRRGGVLCGGDEDPEAVGVGVCGRALVMALWRGTSCFPFGQGCAEGHSGASAPSQRPVLPVST